MIFYKNNHPIFYYENLEKYSEKFWFAIPKHPKIKYEKDSIKTDNLLNHKYIQYLNTCKDRAYFRYFSFSCLIHKNIAKIKSKNKPKFKNQTC